MRKKLLVSIICITALLAGCGNAGTNEISDTAAAEVTENVTNGETTSITDESETEESESETELQTETESETSVETEQKTEALPAEIKTLTRDELGINEDGSLSEAFTGRIEELLRYNPSMSYMVYPGLYDFDNDGIPEIFLIKHNGGQGPMPCDVYSASDLSLLGEFEGFCRDGFTHFNSVRGGTMIHNYYEHSNFLRHEDIYYASLLDGSFVNTLLYCRNGSSRDGERYATIGVTENNNDEAVKSVTGFPGANFWTDGYTLISYYDGYAFTSYATGAEYVEFAAAAVESYNNYIKYSQLAPHNENEDYYNLVLVGDKNQMAFWQDYGSTALYFFGEDGEKTLLSDTTVYYNIYKLWDDIVVCQPFGNSARCDVYTVNDGKPELIEEISGVGMFFDYSGLYNGCFEMIHSIYDATTFGSHTFKKYQFYFTKDGIREYGSIVVPTEEFYSVYGDAITDIEKQITNEEYEIYEVLYRYDDCFILNCRRQLYSDDPPQPVEGGYSQKYAVVKPMIGGTLSEIIEWDGGRYLTALCPDIAVYPEKMNAGIR